MFILLESKKQVQLGIRLQEFNIDMVLKPRNKTESLVAECNREVLEWTPETTHLQGAEMTGAKWQVTQDASPQLRG